VHAQKMRAVVMSPVFWRELKPAEEAIYFIRIGLLQEQPRFGSPALALAAFFSTRSLLRFLAWGYFLGFSRSVRKIFRLSRRQLQDTWAKRYCWVYFALVRRWRSSY